MFKNKALQSLSSFILIALTAYNYIWVSLFVRSFLITWGAFFLRISCPIFLSKTEFWKNFPERSHICKAFSAIAWANFALVIVSAANWHFWGSKIFDRSIALVSVNCSRKISTYRQYCQSKIILASTRWANPQLDLWRATKEWCLFFILL